jgi:tripartite-type tricarboxylate transporter receptor subunit TctC
LAEQEGAVKFPHRRQFLHLTAGAAAFSVTSRIASAQTYPTRPIHIIVGAPPGGGTDITARLMGQWLSERLGQQFIIENRSGAGGNIATEVVVRAPPDGYTLLMALHNNAINATLYENLNFNFIRDIAPVASINRVPNVIDVNPSIPARTVPEFIAFAKANPGKLNISHRALDAAKATCIRRVGPAAGSLPERPCACRGSAARLEGQHRSIATYGQP